MKSVGIFLATGFEEIEAITIIDVLRRADIDAKFISIQSDKNVLGAHKISIMADLILDDFKTDDFDMIVFPGGMPGASNLKQSDKVAQIIKEFNDKNLLIGAICASPWVISDVIKNRYTCYPGFEKNVNKAGYEPDQNVIIDKNIITSRGPATAMEFALNIVEQLCGNDAFVEIKNQLLYKG